MQLVDCSDCGTSIEFALQLIRGLLFTDSLIAPTDPERSSETLPTNSSTVVASQIAPAVYGNSPKSVHALTADQQRALWHCRLGHTNARSVSDLHKFVDGIPKMARDDPLSSCPLCKRAKLRKADRGPTEDAEPTECWQMIQIDVGFMIQKSDKKTKKNVQSEVRNSDGPASKKPRQKKARRLVANLRAMDDAPRRSSRNKRFAGSYSDTQRKRSTSPPEESPSPPPPGDATATNSPSPPPFRPPPSDELWSVEKIMAHQGPLERSDRRYRGDTFNLKILWSTKETTWEPLSTFFEDQPEMVVEYAKNNNLLTNPH